MTRYDHAVAQLELWKSVAIISGGLFTFITLFFAVVEYARQNHNLRASRFIEMRRRFLETELFRDILNLLATDDPRLRDVPIQDRRNFGGFFEEVALMVNSRLISDKVAHYMFGDYVMLVARSQNFWHGLDRDGVYWTVFREFAQRMETLRQEDVGLTRALRF